MKPSRMNWLPVLAGVCLMAAVSGLMRGWGLWEVTYFNKGAVSLTVFGIGYRLYRICTENRAADRRRFRISWCLGWLLAFTEILGTSMRLSETVGGVALNPGGVLWMFLSSLVMAGPVSCFFFWLSGRSFEGKAGQNVQNQNRFFLISWAVLFLGSLPCALAFYPGLYCYDMIWQWGQYVSGAYNTHHPLIHTVFSAGLIELGQQIFGSYEKGLFLHSLVQLLILTGCEAFGLRFLRKIGTKLWLTAGVGAFFLLFPFFPVLGISTTKDVIFGALFLAVTVCLCDMIREGRFWRGWRLAGFVILSVLMCLFRNNAVYGLAVLAGLLILVWISLRLTAARKKDKKENLKKAAGFTAGGIGLICLVMFLSQLGFAGLERGLDADHGSRAEMLSLPMQQMARAYSRHQEEFTPQEREQLLYYFDENSLLSYQYYVSDPVKAGMHIEAFEEKTKDFVKLWMEIGKKFPGEYLAAPLYNTFGIWYLGGDSSCYVEYQMSPSIDESRTVEIRSRIPWLMEYHSWFTDLNIQNALPGLSVIFYTSFYSWCVVTAAGVLLAKKKYRYLAIPVFLLCYEFTLLFGPCMIPRYMMGVMLSVPFLMILTFQRQPGTADEPYKA